MRKILYFYMSLENEEKLSHLESYFKQQIWLSPLSSFNDPFEGLFQRRSLNPEIILTNPIILEQFLELHRQNGKSDISREAFLSGLKSAEFQEALLAYSNDILDILQSHGAICLTPDPTSILMWAYYGNSHKGCCLSVELDFQFIQNKTGISDLGLFVQDIYNGETILSFCLPETGYDFVLTKIRYEEKLPIIDLNELINLKKPIERTKYLVSHSVGVKSLHWQHEKEFRLIANTNSVTEGMQTFLLKDIAPFLKVTGVITGSRISPETKKRVEKLAQQYEINLSQASCSTCNSYKMVISSPSINTKCSTNSFLEHEIN